MAATQEGGNAKCVLGIEDSGAPGWPRPLLVVINPTPPPFAVISLRSLTLSRSYSGPVSSELAMLAT